MRTQVFAALAALSLAAAGRAADCVVLGAPTNLAAVIELYTGANGPYRTIHLTWKNPVLTFAEAQQVALRSRVERRDVTSNDNATWTVLQRSQDDLGYFSDGGTFNGIRGDTDPPTLCSLSSCTEPGRTYEYRVFVEYAYKPGCTQYDAGKYTNATPPSNVFRIAIPGPPPAQPQNVRAVAHPSKKQVRIAWNVKSPPPDQFRIERQRVLAGPGAKDEPTFETLAVVGVQQSKVDAALAQMFVDRKVETDAEYIYRVAAVVAGLAQPDAPFDRAFTAKSCPVSQFAIWSGSDDASWVSPSVSMVPTFDVNRFGFLQVALLPPSRGPNFALSDDKPGLDGDSEIVMPVAVTGSTDVFPGLPADSRGKFTARMRTDDAFEPDAWRSADMEVRFGKRVMGGEMLLEVEPGETFETTVCGSLAASKLKNETASVGQVVTFLFRVVALGPAPLYSGQLSVSAQVTGGVIAEAATAGGKELVRLIGDPTGARTATFEIGALGPVRRDRSEQAVIALRAAADVPGEMVCTMTLIAENGGPNANFETVRIPHPVYRTEVLVATPGVTKRR